MKWWNYGWRIVGEIIVQKVTYWNSKMYEYSVAEHSIIPSIIPSIFQCMQFHIK